jgi:saccharopine dehydrogenase-like NADP-dependent oxidoreductase
LKLSVIGAGGVGQVIVGHLARTDGARVKVGDIDRSRLQEVAKATQGQVAVSRLDAGNPDQVRRLIKGSEIVINASHPRFNMLIMKQALKTKVHYIDLAGYPSEQMKQDQKWKKAGLVAILGMGEDPGLSNIMARQSVDMLDHVSEIRIRDGETSTSETYPFVALFAPDVFLEEAISPANYFENGEMKKNPPMSEREMYPFPPPIGDVPVYRMDHEEVHTLPRYLPKKPSFVDFKLALTDDAVSAIKLMQSLGLLERNPIKVGGVRISPLSVLLSLLPAPAQIGGKIHGNAGILVETKGEASGQQYTQKLYAMMTHDEAFEKYRSNATSFLTGTPTAVCAAMLAEGKIRNRGVVVPESLDAAKFIEQARGFGIQVQTEKTRF